MRNSPRAIAHLLFAIFSLGSACMFAADTTAPANPKPMERAHAHNDYEHKRPLFDALEHGFCSVEADIHLVEGQLLVAHSRSQVKTEGTLEALYLNPLRERVQKYGGRGFLNGPEFILFMDRKGGWS